MDRVRLGRVLGRGARMAARTVYEAVDAATTPTPAVPDARQAGAPSAANRTDRAETGPRPASPVRQPGSGQQSGPAAVYLRPAAAVVRSAHRSSAGRKAGFLQPLKKASRAVVLEVTGSFYALFGLSFAVAAWRQRMAFHLGGPPLQRLVLYVALAAVFGYFAASSFLRAARPR